MLTKNQIKWVHSLELKKNRKKEGLFVAEGPKVVGDLQRAGYVARALFSTTERPNAQLITDDELRKLSFLQHPQEVLAVFEIPKTSQFSIPNCEATTLNSKLLTLNSSLSLALDGVQDPGNLGTIIRLADWFGIDTIYCSLDSADAYNPKVIQATMGSIARVHIIYTDLAAFIDSLPTGTPVYGTFLDGENIYRQTLQPQGVIVMGNEGKGVSPEIARRVSHRLLIPNYPEGRATADSLNVAIATAIVCSEFRRQP